MTPRNSAGALNRITTTARALRAHARGLYPAEGAAEILINHAVWLHRTDFTTQFVRTNHVNGIDLATIDWQAAIATLDAGRLPCSGGESRILRVAASLAEGIPVDLRDMVTGIDSRNIDIVLTALLHASGRRPNT
jgi:hypothetical protein